MLRLYNTMSRQLENFEPIKDNHVRMYTCGPTVYDFSHIGNLRTFLFEDILRRTLRHFGYSVTQVMNLTDIDDKTIRGALESDVSLREYTDPFVEAFFEDLATLRIEPAEHYPRATDYIPQMEQLVQKLLDDGTAYESDGSIYFRVGSFPTYGKLSGAKIQGNLAGARIDADEYEKEDVRDFVLWKASKEGEPSWETAFGPGRPGWHIECSAMAMSLLGQTFDIHTGGVDNIFPHHENEIAQSEGATGVPFANLWMHAEHLSVENEKMAKSRGNFFTLRDLIEKGFDPVVLRYLLISVPYRQKLNFTFDGLHAASQAIERICNAKRRLDNSPAMAEGSMAIDVVTSFQKDFRKALGDDLNTARALAALHTLMRQINTALDSSGISQTVRDALDIALDEADSVLSIFDRPSEESSSDDAEIAALVAERFQARADKEWARADAIRDQLTEMGIVIEDTPHGTSWHRG